MQRARSRRADRRAARALLAGALSLASAWPVLAQDEGRDAHLALQQRDGRLFEAGWRLVTGNAAFCRRTVPAIGLLLHDARTYPDPAAARRALALTGDIAAQWVAAGSPADAAGLRAGATLTRLEGRELASAHPPSHPAWQRPVDLQDAIDRALARRGTVELGWTAPGGASGTARIAGVPACRSRFEVTGIGRRAVADGERVVFGESFPGFAWPEEEFAAAVAHELAHNVLGHRAWLDRHGRSRDNVRLTEREADRLMPWLLANAGYPPEAAHRFMRRWGPGNDGGLLRRRTHAGWEERAAAIAAEVPLVLASLDEGGANWSRRFRREAGMPALAGEGAGASEHQN